VLWLESSWFEESSLQDRKIRPLVSFCRRLRLYSKIATDASHLFRSLVVETLGLGQRYGGASSRRRRSMRVRVESPALHSSEAQVPTVVPVHDQSRLTQATLAYLV